VKKETATTLKVMRAFPDGKLDFKPHDRSSTAKKVMSTFLSEMYLIESYALGENIDRSIFQTYSPDKKSTLISDFETARESKTPISRIRFHGNRSIGDHDGAERPIIFGG